MKRVPWNVSLLSSVWLCSANTYTSVHCFAHSRARVCACELPPFASFAFALKSVCVSLLLDLLIIIITFSSSSSTCVNHLFLLGLL